ncbi:fructokinase [Thorsellia kenyensis]|uniref:Fructokinase n=1 Tax=Thorsellia kenyensis TaxID=1549888 RepID=A0ABV6C9X6_9GAMM
MRIGIDLGGTKVEVIALADNGIEIFRHRIDSPQGDYNKTIDALVHLVNLTEHETNLKGTVGLGMPGTISPFTGKVKNANSTWLNGHAIDKDLSLRLNREIRVANDANCLAVSEATDGAGQGKNTVFAIIIGTGCGAGIAIDGKVHSGANGNAGEWGHNPLPWMNSDDIAYSDDTLCYCQKRGCIETFISGTGFMNDYQRLSNGPRINGRLIMEKVEQNCPIASKAFENYQIRLGKAIAQVINQLDPDVFVLGGGMSNIDKLYDALPDLILPWVFGGEFQTPILKAQHGDSSGVRGAAWLWPKE